MKLQHLSGQKVRHMRFSLESVQLKLISNDKELWQKWL